MLSDHVLWFLVVGVLTASMGILAPLLGRVWISAPQVQMAAGVAIGPVGLGLVSLDWTDDAKLLEVLSEIAVIVSLYTAGIKMRLPLRDRRWVTPLVLAFLTMAVTVGLATSAGWAVLGLPAAAALLLAAVLAPTDPVLADEVQVEHPDDDDRLRRALTGEAGLNDGTAFPFVLLAVGLIAPELHDLGEGLWRWVAVDLLWKIVGGLAFGAAAGRLLGRVVMYARERLPRVTGADELLTLGLIALIYGLALAVHTYAFLAVFAAAVALRGLEMQEDREEDVAEELAAEQTRVGDTLEQITALFLMLTVGLLLTPDRMTDGRAWAFAAVMLLAVRPLAVLATTWFCDLTRPQRWMTAWFGIRGIGTVYYLSHAFVLGVAGETPEVAERLADCAVVTIAASILAHGVSVTPMMKRYGERHADDAS